MSVALIVAVTLATASSVAAQSPLPDPARARAAFDRFCALEGSWVGSSTQGWEEDVSYRVIAAGSVVMETSFDAHPDETMVTMFHLDGDRLLLTHYCAARNQPRLIATSIDEDAAEVVFEFLDATGIDSRDRGHMDKVVWRFDGPDRFTSQWTWYQDGEERWMEEVENRRRISD